MTVKLEVNWFEGSGRPAFSECGIKIGDNRRTCDVGAFGTEPSLRTAVHPASALTTVVEVVSEESRTRDHVDKPREYAAAGIPEYWIVDEHESDQADGMISMFRLVLTSDGPRYQLQRRVSVRELGSAG